MHKVSATGYYILYQHESRLFLSVLCGTVGLYEIAVELDPSEAKEYQTRGNDFLMELARKISGSPKSYAKRHTSLSQLTGVRAPKDDRET